MIGWAGFALAWTAFVGTHFVPTRPAIRSRLIGAIGRRAWFSIYGFVSLLVTAWVIAAAAWPPYLELWPQLPWTRWVPNVAMPLAIAVNILRVTGTALLADYRMEFALGFYHSFSGWLVFVIGFGLLWGVGKLIFRRTGTNR